MTTDPITGATTTAAPTASASAQATLSADYEAFLQLLTAQVANQDPLEPMDSTTFVSQLAQLAQVEQSIMTNANLETISAQLATSDFSEVAMIGQTVLISSGDIDKPATGGAELTYALDEQAASVDAVILAADGTELRRYTGLPTEAEEAHDLYWDGNDAAGLPMPEGQYTVKIEALDADGDPLAYETFVGASVDSVIYSNGMTQLALSNGTVVASTEVYEVR